MTTTNGLPPVTLPKPALTPASTTTAAPTAAPTTTAPPTTPAPTTTGLDAATTAGPAPQGSTPLGAGVSAGVSALSARLGQALMTPKTPLLELRPGLYPDAVSVTAVLKQLGNSPQGLAVVDNVVSRMKTELGIEVPPALVAAAKANPERITDLLALTPGQMRLGFDAVNAKHKLQTAQTPNATPAPTKTRQLPKTTKTQNLDTIAIKRPEGDLKQLAPGLWQGDVKNDKLDDNGAKKNIVLAEIFDRLAANPTAAKGNVFAVEHNGHKFTNLDKFIAELVKDGHTVDAVITHRVADFCALKTKAPDGSIIDVPAALLVKTGVTDKNGNEAIVPGVHSEVVFHVRSSAATKGPKLDGDIKFYQGMPNTGFFPADVMRKSTWTGRTEAAQLDQTQALKAIRLAAVLSDVIIDASASKDLAMSGYGVTGVCNDSVAVLQFILCGGNVTGYPLFMRDDELIPEIEKRLKDKNRTDDAELRELLAAIKAVPSDDTANPTSKARALSSVPYAPGQEPFASLQEARTILSQP